MLSKLTIFIFYFFISKEGIHPDIPGYAPDRDKFFVFQINDNYNDGCINL